MTNSVDKTKVSLLVNCFSQDEEEGKRLNKHAKERFVNIFYANPSHPHLGSHLGFIEQGPTDLVD